jgi:hypothetical protein
MILKEPKDEKEIFCFAKGRASDFTNINTSLKSIQCQNILS